MGLWLNFWYSSLRTMQDRWAVEEVCGGSQAAWRCQNQIGSSDGCNEWFHLSRCCLQLDHVYLIAWEPCKQLLLSDPLCFFNCLRTLQAFAFIRSFYFLVLNLWSLWKMLVSIYRLLFFHMDNCTSQYRGLLQGMV